MNILPLPAKSRKIYNHCRGFCLSAVFLVFLFGARLARPQLISAQTALSDPSMKGKVIHLGDNKPWLVVQSTTQTGTKSGYVYIMNIGQGYFPSFYWGTNSTTPTNAISSLADSGTIYSFLPATIGGVAKATALGSHTWQWDRCSQAGTCSNL
ncbi:hypothetical protein FWH30_01365, partial [Microgenomates group bacterium]|nr:hypothetical protein [Microgenomates group bacterium]